MARVKKGLNARKRHKKILKKAKGVDRELVKWVKAHTDNKFLPFGPLL